VSTPSRLLAALALLLSGGLHAQLYLHGYRVIPGVGPMFLLQAAGAIAVGRGRRARRPAWMALGAAGLAAQLVCTLLAPGTARALITFGGDAGCMVLGAVGVATLWTDPEGPLGRGWLRWGFLLIGACALVDALDTWLRARLDPGQLPLGEIEGVGLSDASTLMELHGWGAGVLTGRYLTLGLACLAALGVGYALGLARARVALRAAEAVAGPR
jgi:hypothetical protein